MHGFWSGPSATSCNAWLLERIIRYIVQCMASGADNPLHRAMHLMYKSATRAYTIFYFECSGSTQARRSLRSQRLDAMAASEEEYICLCCQQDLVDPDLPDDPVESLACGHTFHTDRLEIQLQGVPLGDPWGIKLCGAIGRPLGCQTVWSHWGILEVPNCVEPLGDPWGCV